MIDKKAAENEEDRYDSFISVDSYRNWKKVRIFSDRESNSLSNGI